MFVKAVKEKDANLHPGPNSIVFSLIHKEGHMEAKAVDSCGWH